MTRKDVGLRIRLQRDLRDEFLDAYRAQDPPAAQVLREFMRSFITESDEGSADDSVLADMRKQGESSK